MLFRSLLFNTFPPALGAHKGCVGLIWAPYLGFHHLRRPGSPPPPFFMGPPGGLASHYRPRLFTGAGLVLGLLRSLVLFLRRACLPQPANAVSERSSQPGGLFRMCVGSLLRQSPFRGPIPVPSLPDLQRITRTSGPGSPCQSPVSGAAPRSRPALTGTASCRERVKGIG